MPMGHALQASPDFFDDEEITKVDAVPWQPSLKREPRPEDFRIERVTLRKPPTTGTEIDFRGPLALHEANAMIGTWRRLMSVDAAEVGFEVRFGDGLIFSGKLNLADDFRRRDLRRVLRDPSAFARAFPGNSDQVFATFLATYTID